MKKHILIPLIAIAFLFIGAGCGQTPQPSEQQQVAENQKKLATVVPIPTLDNSLERMNISKRLSTFDDPNKVSYIYLVNYGRVMAFYTIKGKVTGGGKRLTNTVKLERCDKGEFSGECEMPAPELDGSYGSSNPYIFFWTTEGVYVQWSGDYMLVDEPLKLTAQPELVRQIQ